jgi:hypothetical protein
MNLAFRIVQECGGKFKRPDSVVLIKAAEVGRIMVCQRLFDELGLRDYPERKIKLQKPLCQSMLSGGTDYNRVCEPKSKYSLLRWLEDVQFEGIKIPKEITCLMQKRFAQIFYRNIDFLIKHKEEIETFLYHKPKTLFNLEVEIVPIASLIIDF